MSSSLPVCVCVCVCVCVPLGVHHAMRMRRIVVCGIPRCTTSQFSGKNIIEHKMCFVFLYNFYLKHFSFWEEMREVWSNIYIDFHV